MKIFATAATAILIAGCAATPYSPGITGGLVAGLPIPADCGEASLSVTTNLVCAGKDLADVTAGRPAPLKAFEYSESNAFDLQLSGSMAGNLSKITVTVPEDIALPLEDIAAQAVPAADSERLVFWLTKIRETGGQNKACPTENLESAALGAWAIKMAGGYLKTWVIYRPASKYDSILMYDPTDETLPIKSIIFTPRSETELECP